MSMNDCHQCGKKIHVTAKYCRHCGFSCEYILPEVVHDKSKFSVKLLISIVFIAAILFFTFNKVIINKPIVADDDAGSVGLLNNKYPNNVKKIEDSNHKIDVRVDDGSYVFAPKFFINDRYKFSTTVVNHIENKKSTTIEERVVVSVDDKINKFKFFDENGNEKKSVTRDVNMGLLESVSLKDFTTIKYTPSLPYFKYPFKTGDKWEGDFDELIHNTKNNKKINNHRSSKGEVISKEFIDTFFGKFQAYKIKFEQNWIGLNGEPGSSVDLSWYVPDLRMSVKSEIKEFDGTGIKKSTLIVMLDYKIN